MSRRVQVVWYFSVAATLLSIAASVWLAFWPVTQSFDEAQNPSPIVPASLVEVHGVGLTLLVLSMPILISGAALWGVYRWRQGRYSWGRWLVWRAAVVLGLFSVATAFSLVIAYLPAAVALFAAALMLPKQAPS